MHFLSLSSDASQNLIIYLLQELVTDLKRDFENDIRRLETDIIYIQSVITQDTSDENIKRAEKLRYLQADLHHAHAMELKYNQSFFRVPFGSGVVGGVAVSGKSINACDLQPADLAEFEKIQSGRSKTRSILCCCAHVMVK
jgi:hypothetical protein